MPTAQQAVPVIDRILRRVHVDSDTGCWLWMGALSHNGYGLVGVGSRTDRTTRQVRVHRVTYEHYRDAIPEGLELDHLCRQATCCNPDHLEPVTRQENARRWAALIVACPKGHPYDDANTYRYPDGRRRCRTCSREEMRERRRAQ